MTEPNRTVYLVDDDEAVQRAASFMLRTSGYLVKTCPSGLAFLKADADAPGISLITGRVPAPSHRVRPHRLTKEGEMKNVLLYANEDAGLESRLQAAFDIARAFDAHLECIQVRPFSNQVIGDPFGGTYALQTILEDVIKAENAHKDRMEVRLREEGVSWDWARYDGGPAQVVIDRSHLADLIIVSAGDAQHGSRPLRAMIADVAIHARSPVLAVPEASRSFNCFGVAMLAWNGSAEAANALRLTLPILGKAGTVKIVTVTDQRSGFPVVDASQYLARHGITSEIHEWPAGERPIEDALIDAAERLGTDYVVMGAYGHSRFREAVLGGATRGMIDHGGIPLLLAH